MTADVMEEFEVVESRKKKETTYDSDSEADEIPRSLVVNVSVSQTYSKDQIMQALSLIPEEKKTVTIRDNIENMELLWGNKQDQIRSQWKMPKQYSITCLDVGGDEDVWDESSLARTFIDGREVEISCPAIIFVPGKVIAALTFLNDQDVEE